VYLWLGRIIDLAGSAVLLLFVLYLAKYGSEITIGYVISCDSPAFRHFTNS